MSHRCFFPHSYYEVLPAGFEMELHDLAGKLDYRCMPWNVHLFVDYNTCLNCQAPGTCLERNTCYALRGHDKYSHTGDTNWGNDDTRHRKTILKSPMMENHRAMSNRQILNRYRLRNP